MLPKFFPDDWTGGFVLLLMIFVLSSFLDNIAAAIFGGTIAMTVFNGKVHIGYLAVIVAVSNAGGSGSVVGDTTTTMMWIDGVSPLDVFEAYVAAGVAIFIFGIPASLQQHRYSPIAQDPPAGIHIDWTRVGVVLCILLAVLGWHPNESHKVNKVKTAEATHQAAALARSQQRLDAVLMFR